LQFIPSTYNDDLAFCKQRQRTQLLLRQKVMVNDLPRLLVLVGLPALLVVGMRLSPAFCYCFRNPSSKHVRFLVKHFLLFYIIGLGSSGLEAIDPKF